MADIKISQLTAKGANLASSDLIEISESDGQGGYVTKSVTGANVLSTKQNTLVSGTNIKTIENQSLLGAGNIDLSKSDVGLGNVDNTSDLSKPISTATQTALNNKQNTIVNSDSITEGSTNLFLTTAERTKLVNTSGTNTGDQTNISGTANNVTGIVAVANGGTGTATPSLVAGTNVTISGTFPNQTINAAGGGGGGVTQIVAGTNVTISPAGGTGVVTVNAAGGGGGGTQIGDLLGGGVVAAVFNEGGVNKALIVSLTNLGNVPYTIPAYQSTIIGVTAQNFFNGLGNTNAIIAQTGAAATTAYAAGLARLFAGGGYNDWYLPALYEHHMLYNSAAITNRIAGVTPFDSSFNYFTSTEQTASTCYALNFGTGNTTSNYGKQFGGIIRAVRIHTI